MIEYHLAPLNIAKMKYAIDDPLMADFVNQLDSINNLADAYTVLWWVPADHQPSLEEASSRLQSLIKHGPNEKAFTFKQGFPPPIISD